MGLAHVAVVVGQLGLFPASAASDEVAVADGLRRAAVRAGEGLEASFDGRVRSVLVFGLATLVA